MLIGIVGLNGSGKDTVAQLLVKRHSFVHRDVGQEIRDELKGLGEDFRNRDKMISWANYRRKEMGLSYWVKKAIDSAGNVDLAISSIRNPGEIEEIKSRGGVIIEVFAEQRIRFDRTVERIKNDPTAHGDIKSFDAFSEKEAGELSNPDPSKQQLIKCISLSEYRLDNNGAIEELDMQVEELFKKIRAKKKML